MQTSLAARPLSPAGGRAAHAVDSPPAPRRPDEEPLAVLIHPALRPAHGPDIAAPADWAVRPPDLPASPPQVVPARPLRERTRCQCTRTHLALSLGLCMGYATGAFVLVGLDFSGHSEQDSLRWGAIAGAATTVVIGALGWHALRDVDCPLAPAADDTR